MEGILRGLDQKEVEENRKRFGMNVIPQGKRWLGPRILLRQFKSPLVYILLIAVGITIFLNDFVDGGVILLAVIVNTVLGFVQEYKAERSLQALRSVLAPKAEVIREGMRKLILAEELVPGDILFVSNEHKIAADGVIVEEDGLSVNEAVITGESIPTEKFDYRGKDWDVDRLRKDLEEAESKYKVMMGTNVVVGVGKVLVLKTGRETVVGRIAGKLVMQKIELTPLQRKISKLSGQLAWLFGGVSLLVLFIGWWLGSDWRVIFPTAVALAVAAVPEGLVISLTVILAVGAQRMLKQKVLVRQLAAAEAMGAVEVICADKTGTLTEGVMRVTKVITKVKGDEKELILAAMLCNDMRDPLELAMNEWAKSKDGMEMSVGYRRVDSLPFDHRNKYIATLDEKSNKQVVSLSGAPEVVLGRCQLSRKEVRYWEGRFEDLAKKGYRLVGFARKKRKEEDGEKIGEKDLREMIWLGILVYEDPVRKGVKEALQRIGEAGVGIKVITGDHRETAAAILRQLGLLGEETGRQIMVGDELTKMTDQELGRLVGEVVLFARTTPDQKLRIVEALKNQGKVVAMTGDGVNDAPALKRADVGIVVSGATEVAKETADMVLMDDDFANIVGAVEEGRGIEDNFRKIITYLLADAFVGILVVLWSMALGWPLPLLAVQILWVNLITDGLPSLALTMEPKEAGILRRRPRGLSELIDIRVKSLVGLISILAAVGVLLVFGVYYWKWRIYLGYARTMAFGFLGVASLLYVWSSRSWEEPFWKVKWKGNWWLLGAVVLGLGLQLLVIYQPRLAMIFRTERLSWTDWGVIGIATIVMMMTIELMKSILRRRTLRKE